MHKSERKRKRNKRDSEYVRGSPELTCLLIILIRNRIYAWRDPFTSLIDARWSKVLLLGAGAYLLMCARSLSLSRSLSVYIYIQMFVKDNAWHPAIRRPHAYFEICDACLQRDLRPYAFMCIRHTSICIHAHPCACREHPEIKIAMWFVRTQTNRPTFNKWIALGDIKSA